jgi:glycerophosphoryl diester phosphodiesterase
MPFRLLYILVLLLLSCSKKNDFSEVQVIGHAGMGLEMSNSIFHDNSLEAIELALTLPGSNGVEIDIQMDLNGRLWLFHDEVLNEETNGTNCISSNTSEYLKTLRYNSLKQEKLAGLSQIPFNQFQNKRFFLDLKTLNKCSGNTVSIEDFKAALTALDLPENCTIILSDPNWIPYFKDDFTIYFASDDFQNAKTILTQEAMVKGLVIRNAAVNMAQTQEIIEQNKEIYLFEIRSPKGVKSALQKRPSGIISDDLRAAISAVAN